MKLIIKLITLIMKRATCKHSYKIICTYSGHHIELNKDIIFDHDYECVKCGKRINIPMDKEYQIN